MSAAKAAASDAAAAHTSKLLLCLGIVYLVWGSSYLATRIGVQRLPPLLFGGVRFFLAGLLLIGVATWRARLSGIPAVRPNGPEVWQLCVIGLFGVAICNGLNAWAMQWVPSNESSLLNATSAFWIAGFGMLGHRAHRPSARAIAGLCVGFAGTVLLIWPQGATTGSSFAGVTIPQLAILAACVCWSGATIYLRNTHTRLDLLTLTGMQMLIGGVLLALGGFVSGEGARWHNEPTGLAAMIYLTLFSSCLAYTAYAWLARNATPSQVGTYGYVNPALAVVLGWLILDESMSALQIGGTAVILAGVVLVNWPERAGLGQPAS